MESLTLVSSADSKLNDEHFGSETGANNQQ